MTAYKQILVALDFSDTSLRALDHAMAGAQLRDAQRTVETAQLTSHQALKIGDPSTEIVAHSRDGASDLIVLGTRGRTGVTHFLLGGVAEHVVRTATCPVLTVR